MSEQTLQAVVGWIDDLRSEDASTRQSAEAAILALVAGASAPVARGEDTALAVKVATLQAQVDQMRARLSELPKTSLLSTSFLARAFTVWGHVFVVQLILSIPFVIFVFAALMDEASRR